METQVEVDGSNAAIVIDALQKATGHPRDVIVYCIAVCAGDTKAALQYLRYPEKGTPRVDTNRITIFRNSRWSSIV